MKPANSRTDPRIPRYRFALHEIDPTERRCYGENVSAPSQLSIPAGEQPGPVSPGARRRWLPFRDWDWRHFLFYLGVPAGIATYAALNNWAVLQLSGYQTTLAFYAGHSFIPWWTSAVATYLCMRLLRPWQPPKLLLLALGSFLACLVILPYSSWLTEYFAVGWVSGDPDGHLSSEHIYSEVGFWAFTARASVIWILVNFAFDRFLGLPRYRYDTPGTAPEAPVSAASASTAGNGGLASPEDWSGAGDAQALRFLQRLPTTVSADEVIALKAEQHYLKVYTADRSYLTLYRFSDAVAEMDPAAGRQVHRSFWVRSSAIRAIKRDSRKYVVELVNGLAVPISVANRGLIRELARTHNIPVHPPL